MLIQITLLFATLLILPGYFIYALWRGQEKSQLEWFVKVLYTGAFLFYIFLAGRWDWLSYYLRFAWLALFAVALIISYRRIRDVPIFVSLDRPRWLGLGSNLIVLLLFLGALTITIRGYFYADQPVRLAFPLQDGRYYIGQGGNSSLLNYHNSNQAQQYALDIVAINAAGMRVRGIYPSDVERYVIFGDTVHSPCDGIVKEAIDGLPDQAPPTADREHLAGNHVVIVCKGVQVLLAHLQSESVLVQAGDTVVTGQPLGQVGNSGNTTEPHLHIHAVKANNTEDILAGKGVPLLLEEKFAVRNMLFWARY